jgi:hypothetical protein
MAVLTFHELLPIAFDYAGHGHATRAVFIGMAFMSARFEFNILIYQFLFFFLASYLLETKEKKVMKFFSL